MKFAKSAILLLGALMLPLEVVSVSGCTDRTDKWNIDGRTLKWCVWASKDTENRCKSKNLFNDCPVACDSCSPTDVCEMIEESVTDIKNEVAESSSDVKDIKNEVTELRSDVEDIKKTLDILAHYIVPSPAPSVTPTEEPSSIPSESPTAAPVNVALGKPTVQSSTYEGAVSSLAVDGNRDGNSLKGSSVTHTELDTNAWWSVSLEQKYHIVSIKVFNRTDCCNNRLENFFLEIFNNGEKVWTYTHNGYPGYETDIVVSTGEAPVFGDKVEISITNNYLSLAEVEVYAQFKH